MKVSKLFASGLALSIALIVLVQVATTLTAGATPGPKGERKVTICHATNSNQNPYTVNKVDKSSIDEVNNKFLNGHGDHEGPVWHEGIADHSWGDIIPAFTNDAGNSYPGQNWTAEGQAIYNNGCKLVEVTTPETPNVGGQGGGQVLGTSTTTEGKGSGTLLNTGVPAIANVLVGASILGSAGYVTLKSRKLTV